MEEQMAKSRKTVLDQSLKYLGQFDQLLGVLIHLLKGPANWRGLNHKLDCRDGFKTNQEYNGRGAEIMRGLTWALSAAQLDQITTQTRSNLTRILPQINPVGLLKWAALTDLNWAQTRPNPLGTAIYKVTQAGSTTVSC